LPKPSFWKQDVLFGMNLQLCGLFGKIGFVMTTEKSEETGLQLKKEISSF
jgi:hypothetical protein